MHLGIYENFEESIFISDENDRALSVYIKMNQYYKFVYEQIDKTLKLQNIISYDKIVIISHKFCRDRHGHFPTFRLF